MMRLLDYWSRRTGRPTPGDTDVSALADEVFHAYAPRVYGLAWRMLGDEADAETVTLNVLLKVVGRLGTVPGEDDLTAWLYRVTIDAVLTFRRQRACRWARRGPQGEGRNAVEQAIGRLPEVYRDVLVLADGEGLTCAEVGELLGMRLRAVEGRLQCARLLMRQALIAPIGNEGASE